MFYHVKYMFFILQCFKYILKGDRALKRNAVLSVILSLAMIAVSTFGLPSNTLKVKAAQTEWNYSYTGTVQTFTAPTTGKYSFELIGACGGGYAPVYRPAIFSPSGIGGKTTGEIYLTAGETIYVIVGGQGTMGSGTNNGGFNGGGKAYFGNGSGGGASHLATTNTLISETAVSDLIAVAGGGAGRSVRELYYIPAGSGGGEQSVDMANVGNGSGQDYGYGADRNYGNNGQDSNELTPGGAGGAGYRGGFASEKSTVGGGGGSGFYNSSYVKNGNTNLYQDADTYNLDPSAYMHLYGNGRCKISYAGTAQSLLNITCGGVATVYDRENYSTSGELGTTIALPTPVANANLQNATFLGYSVKKGDGILSGSIDDGYTFTFGKEDSIVEARFSSSFNIISNLNDDNTTSIVINADNFTQNTYFVEQSFDRTNWTKIFEDGTELISAPAVSIGPMAAPYGHLSSHSKEGGYTYDVPATGLYRIELKGGGGGNDAGGTGSGGATIAATFKLLKGQKLYLYGGQPGLDSTQYAYGGGYGGAQAFYAGSGGGGYMCELDGTLILAAAGGGGGTNGYNGGAGRVSTNNPSAGSEGGSGSWSVNTGSNFGTNDAARAMQFKDAATPPNHSGYVDGVLYYDAGGGGGGWYGGIGGIHEHGVRQGSGWVTRGSAGYGGRNGYLSSVNGTAIQDLSETAGTVGASKTSGYAKVTPLSISTYNEDYTVKAYLKDLNAPDAPSNIQVKEIKDNNNQITWTPAKDNGTINYFRATRVTDLYTLNSDWITNEIEEDFSTGLKGYYYYIDENEEGTVTTDDDFTENNNLSVPMVTTKSYLHIASIDNADNLSETTTFEIPVVVEVTCIDLDVDTNEELGRSTTPVSKAGYQMAGNYFLADQTVSGEAWGTNTSVNAYYDGYFYISDSATAIHIPSDENIVYRYFFKTQVLGDIIDPDDFITEPSDEATEYITIENPDGDYNTMVFAQIASEYRVTIPKVIVLSGETKSAEYYVKAEGDIATYEIIKVIPDKTVTLSSYNKEPVDANIIQNFVFWCWNDLDQKAEGKIKADNISAGKWTGTFNFEISLGNIEEAENF